MNRRIRPLLREYQKLKEETLPSGPKITALRVAAPSHLKGVIGGGGARYLIDEMNRGAIGAMPAAEIADIHVAIWNAFKRGDVASARDLYRESILSRPYSSLPRSTRSTKPLADMIRRRFLKTSGLGAAGLVFNPLLSLQSLLAASNTPIPEIKITGIKIHQIRMAPPEPLGYGAASTPQGITRLGGSIVEVSTDAGLTGWGEGRWGGDILRSNPELVIGRSPFEVEAIFDELTERESVAYHRMPRNAPSQGGLDTALWDLVGKAAGKPISQVLGKQYRDRVMPYASAGYRKPSWENDILKGYVDEYSRCVHDLGFRAAKIKTGFGPTEDVAIVAAVREAIGDEIHLGIDSGTPGAYDDGTAIMLGRQLEPFNLEFWEEPINKWDIDGYQRLQNALRVPLASGEFLPVDWTIENYVNKRVVDIVQPDIIDCGLTGGRRILHACAINRVRLVPHTWGGPIRNVASMHWVATIPPLSVSLHQPPALFELHLPEESPAWSLTTEPVSVDKADGQIAVPTGPGLGIEINLDELERYRENLTEI